MTLRSGSPVSTYSIIALSHPDHYVRHRNGLAELTSIASDLEREAASFHVADGLADPRLMSFESILRLGYLRQLDGEVRLQAAPDPSGTAATEEQGFAADATFVLGPGLADVSWVSFESFSRPGDFLRHRDGRLRVERGSDDLFADEATFRLVPGLSPSVVSAHTRTAGGRSKEEPCPSPSA
jgi:hypothetical protein